MASSTVSEIRARGATILTRISKLKPPAALGSYVRAFSGEHQKYESAAARADAASTKRVDALAAVGTADDTLDGSLDALADKLVGAGLGTRQSPFAKFSKYGPARLKKLPYATEVKEVRALVERLRKASPPKDVARALDVVARNAEASAKAIAALAAPVAEYERVLRARDALQPDWDRALRRLKKNADAAWDDDPGTFEAVFAPTEAVIKPTRKRAPAKGKGKGRGKGKGEGGAPPAAGGAEGK